MSLFELQRLFYDIGTNHDVHDRFMAGPATVINDYELTEEERAAVLELDVVKLSQLKVHPILLLNYARSRKMPTDEFVRQLNGAPPSPPNERT